MKDAPRKAAGPPQTARKALKRSGAAAQSPGRADAYADAADRERTDPAPEGAKLGARRGTRRGSKRRARTPDAVPAAEAPAPEPALAPPNPEEIAAAHVELPEEVVELLASLPAPAAAAAATSLAVRLGVSALKQTAAHNDTLVMLHGELSHMRSVCATLAQQNASLAHAFAAQLARKQQRAGAALAAANAQHMAEMVMQGLVGPVPEVGDVNAQGQYDDSDNDSSDDDMDEEMAIALAAVPVAAAVIADAGAA